MDRMSRILFLSGFSIGAVKMAEIYNDGIFRSALDSSGDPAKSPRQLWLRILQMMERQLSRLPITTAMLSAAAVSFSFGLDKDTHPADERTLTRTFVAYLKLALDEESFDTYVPPELSEDATGAGADAHDFGKPVWDFDYPDSSFLVTEGGLAGCVISAVEPGDVVCVPLGSTYPLVLRPEGDHFRIRGYAYVHGIMRGGHEISRNQIFEIHK